MPDGPGPNYYLTQLLNYNYELTHKLMFLDLSHVDVDADVDVANALKRNLM